MLEIIREYRSDCFVNDTVDSDLERLFGKWWTHINEERSRENNVTGPLHLVSLHRPIHALARRAVVFNDPSILNQMEVSNYAIVLHYHDALLPFCERVYAAMEAGKITPRDDVLGAPVTFPQPPDFKSWRRLSRAVRCRAMEAARQMLSEPFATLTDPLFPLLMVSVAEFSTWAAVDGIAAAGEVERLLASDVAERPQTNAARSPCGVFLAMENLDADELTITFVGDRSETGFSANNMLEISARNETRRVALAALDLVDRRRGSINGEGAVLSGMANGKNPINSGANAAKMKRLRDVLRTHLGIRRDPFEPYRKGAGWVPRFTIVDKRDAADERAKREGERRTASYDGLLERGVQFAGSDPLDDSVDGESEEVDGDGDEADVWLEENDPNKSA